MGGIQCITPVQHQLPGHAEVVGEVVVLHGRQPGAGGRQAHREHAPGRTARRGRDSVLPARAGGLQRAVHGLAPPGDQRDQQRRVGPREMQPQRQQPADRAGDQRRAGDRRQQRPLHAGQPAARSDRAQCQQRGGEHRRRAPHERQRGEPHRRECIRALPAAPAHQRLRDAGGEQRQHQHFGEARAWPRVPQRMGDEAHHARDDACPDGQLRDDRGAGAEIGSGRHGRHPNSAPLESRLVHRSEAGIP